MTAPPLLSCFAIVAPGLETFAIAEAQALGLNVVAEAGGFAWTGTAESALQANVALRIASRVLVRLASFEARSFAELERHARKIEWHRVIASGDAVRFRVTCKKSKLYHSDAVAQRLAGTDGRPGNRFTLRDLQDMVFNDRQYAGELFRDQLVAEIARAEANGDPSTYYERWVTALERVVLARNLITPAELHAPAPRPVAISSTSPSIPGAPSTRTLIPPAVFSTPTTLCARWTAIPSPARCLPSSSPASGSSAGTSRGPPSMMCTSDPIRA